MKKLFLLILIPFAIVSCKKDEVIDETPATPFSASSGVYISNEGGFQHGNASVSYFNNTSGTVIADVYKQVNYHDLGDICQSMNIINGKLYIVINNSGKIEVCDPHSMVRSKTINISSPRFICQVDSSKAYVSTYSNQISIINLDNNTVSGTISINGSMDEMILKNNKLYVTNFLSEYLYVINPAADQIIDSIHISKGAASIAADNIGKLWILCGGDYLGTYTGNLYKIDPTSGIIESSLAFPATDFPARLCTDASKDTLYFINSNIYRMSVTDTQLPSSAFVTSSGNSFYAIAVDPSNNEIYVSDAIDYVQKGKIYRYHPDGTQISNFSAGIIPGGFLFF